MKIALSLSIIAGAALVATACQNAQPAPGTGASTAASLVAPKLGRLPHMRRATRPPARAAALSAAGADAGVPARYQALATTFDLENTLWAVPGAAFAVIEHGQVTFTHAFGTTGIASTTPVDADTIFRVGTLTEPLTAAVTVAQLAQHGKLPAAPIASLVPNLALKGPYAALLPVRDLLSNQSGLFDFTAFSTDTKLATNSCGTAPGGLDAFVTSKLFGDNESFMTPPGALYTQSSPNFILAGAAIEQLSGTHYPQAMHDDLFAPLGMARSFFLPSEVVAAGNYSDGFAYNPADGTPWDVKPGDYDCAAYRPYGYAFSSVSDYAKFLQLLLEGNPRVLPELGRLAMETSHVTSRDLGEISGQGYGLTVASGYVSQDNAYYPTKTVSATGEIPGFGAQIVFLPETGFGFVAMGNTTGAAFARTVDLAVTSFGSLPCSAPLPSGTLAAPGRYASYAGTYVDPTGTLGTLVLSDVGGAMRASFPDAAAAGFTTWPEISPTLADSFLVALAGSPNQLELLPDARGRYEYVLLDDVLPFVRVQPDAGP